MCVHWKPINCPDFFPLSVTSSFLEISCLTFIVYKTSLASNNKCQSLLKLTLPSAVEPCPCAPLQPVPVPQLWGWFPSEGSSVDWKVKSHQTKVTGSGRVVGDFQSLSQHRASSSLTPLKMWLPCRSSVKTNKILKRHQLSCYFWHFLSSCNRWDVWNTGTCVHLPISSLKNHTCHILYGPWSDTPVYDIR